MNKTKSKIRNKRKTNKRKTNKRKTNKKIYGKGSFFSTPAQKKSPSNDIIDLEKGEGNYPYVPKTMVKPKAPRPTPPPPPPSPEPEPFTYIDSESDSEHSYDSLDSIGSDPELKEIFKREDELLEKKKKIYNQNRLKIAKRMPYSTLIPMPPSPHLIVRQRPYTPLSPNTVRNRTASAPTIPVYTTDNQKGDKQSFYRVGIDSQTI